MMAFVSELFNYLQKEDAQVVVVCFAAFGVPLFSFLLYLLLRLLRIKIGPVVSCSLTALVAGYTIFGFITQAILCFSGISALKMALIWLVMVIVYGVFALFNGRMIYKLLSVFNETRKQDSGKDKNRKTVEGG